MNVCKVYSWERLTEINLIQTSQVNLRVDEGYRTVVWDYVVAKQIEVRPSMIVLQFGLIENPLHRSIVKFVILWFIWDNRWNLHMADVTNCKEYLFYNKLLKYCSQ